MVRLHYVLPRLKESAVKNRHTLAILAASLLVSAAPATAAIKCWTNAEGVRECGNAVPPEYAQQRTRTLNERGITVNVRERARTAEELAEERRRAEEAARQQAEEERRLAKQAAYDNVLLSTFTTEEELIASRDRKLAAIEATIEVTKLSVQNIRDSMRSYQRRAADLERGGRPIPDDLKADIGNLQQQIDSKHEYVANKEKEMEALKAKYAGDLARFRELKSRAR